MLKHILKLIWNKRRNNLLLFSEIFFCFLVVFAVSAFCIKSFRAYFSPMGYETEPLWVLRQQATSQLDSTTLIETRELLKREILALDGVEKVAFASYAVPFSGSTWSNGGDAMGFEFYTTMIGGDKDYPATLGLKLNAGRYFEESDYTAKYSPVIINQKIVDQYWPEKPILDSLIVFDDRELKVVGIAENIRYRDGFEAEMNTTVLLSPKEDQEDLHDLLVEVAPGSGSELEVRIVNTMSNILKTEDINIQSMHRQRERIARDTWIPVVIFLSIGAFLIINIALGLFGVLFYTISKRRGEIGVRRAMGATRGEIVQQFVLEIYFVALAGMLLGALLCIQVPIMGLLDEDFGYSNLYWAILFSLILISIVVLSCAFWPSRQGAGLHPAVALHEE